MVLVDTSVWIGLYRKKDAPMGQLVWTLVAKNEAAICGQTLVEFLGGFRNDDERKRFRQQLDGFPFLETSREAFQLAADLLAKHPRLGSGDTIIAATAITSKCQLLTFDKDFSQLTSDGLFLMEQSGDV